MPKSPFADARVLIVDDEKVNVDALTRILRAAGYSQIVATTDPTGALGLYADQDPDIVLLDLHMRQLDGLAVLQQLRAAAGPHAFVPVLMLTGDPSSQARSRALSAGAKDFLTKPFEVGEVLLRIRNLLETRYLHREIVQQNQMLEERVRQRTVELESAYLDTLERLASAAEFRDDETGRHTERVGEVAAMLGGALGLPDEEVFLLRRAAPLHDVGKIGIPDVILRKPGPLTSEEWEIMKTHTTIGARILEGGQSRVVQLAEEIALYHHEQWNGQGYPTGIAGEAIPLPGRLVMVADVFDALTSDRVYREAWPVEKVLDYIHQYAGQRFDPQITALCERPDVRRVLLGLRESGSRRATERRIA
jgi:putative two-component system response regulator